MVFQMVSHLCVLVWGDLEKSLRAARTSDPTRRRKLPSGTAMGAVFCMCNSAPDPPAPRRAARLRPSFGGAQKRLSAPILPS